MEKRNDAVHETIKYNADSPFVFHYNKNEEGYPNHWHTDVEIVMPVKNSYAVGINRQSYNLNEYDILIIPSGEIHEMKAPESKGERIVIQFNLDVLSAVRNLTDASYVYYMKPWLITGEDSPELHKTVKSSLLEMLDEMISRKTYFEAAVTNEIIKITLNLARIRRKDGYLQEKSVVRRKEHFSRLNESLTYINSHFTENLDLESAAKIAGFSKFHFTRLFQEFSGLTFSDYLSMVRTNKAEAMLADTSLTVTQIAMESGFQSITTFNRVFKKTKGCSPKEYRQMNYLKRRPSLMGEGAGINTANEKAFVMQIPELTDAPRRAFTPTGVAAKLPGYANPLISHKFGADPWALEYKGRVYLYLTGDIYEYDESGRLTENTCNKINVINIISSSDLLNWTDHGPAKIAGLNGAAEWAENSWAPAVAHKVINGEDRFFLYFSDNTSGIGALTSDSPVGPWSDPLGKPLIHSGVPGAENVLWRSDPAVLVDDDGEGYLYFGGGLPSESTEDVLHPRTARVIRLGADMTSVAGEAVTIDAPAFFQDSGIHKRNGVYYYTYSSNYMGPRSKGYPGRGEIAYMTSDSPLGPFEYKGAIMKSPFYYFGVTGGSNHCIFSFKNKWHIAYHAQTLGKALGRVKGYRSPHINRLFYENDGEIRPVEADMKGAPLDETLNPYERTGAETFAWCAGIRTAAKKRCGSDNAPDMFVTHIRNGDWLAVANADFGDKGPSGFTARVSSLTGGEIEIRADNPVDGEIIGTLAVGYTGGEGNWEQRSCGVNPICGIRDTFFIFKGDNDENLFDFDYWIFEGDMESQQ